MLCLNAVDESMDEMTETTKRKSTMRWQKQRRRGKARWDYNHEGWPWLDPEKKQNSFCDIHHNLWDFLWIFHMNFPLRSDSVKDKKGKYQIKFGTQNLESQEFSDQNLQSQELSYQNLESQESIISWRVCSEEELCTMQHHLWLLIETHTEVTCFHHSSNLVFQKQNSSSVWKVHRNQSCIIK